MRSARFAAVTLVLGFGSTGAAAQGSPCPRRALRPFLALVGRWDVAWEFRVQDTLVTVKATAVLERAAGQCGVIERLEGEVRGERVAQATLLVAPNDDTLELAYLDSAHGGLLTFRAMASDTTIEFRWQHDWGDHVQIVRREYTALQSTSFTTATYMSPNGGATWILVQRARYRRRS